MNKPLGLVILVLAFVTVARAAEPLPKPLVTGLKYPISAVVGLDGKIYVTSAGEPQKDGDGAVLRIENGKAVPFATGLDDPACIAAYQQWLFVADKQRVWRIDAQGKAEVFAAATAFPSPPPRLLDIAADPESGLLYVTDFDLLGKDGRVFRITSKGKVDVVIDGKKRADLKYPMGLVLDGASHLQLADAGTGVLHRVKVADGSTEKLADDLGNPSGMVWDHHGRFFVSDMKGHQLRVIPRPGAKSVVLAEGFQEVIDIALDPARKAILVPDVKAGTLTAVPITIPGAEVDETPLPLETAVAFPDLKWAGWQPETDSGKVVPLRPIVLTHAGDGSNRVFVATQHGVIHVFPNDPKADRTKVFLDIQDRVVYSDNQNEEGFLGLAFHPKFKENGELFVFYTTKTARSTNVVSRFRLRKDDPSRADPASEEELLRIRKPFWNHDGGTLCFGPDGYLYLTHGDGGAANDPFDNGQKLSTLLGKVLRIDVDRKEEGKNYAIPKDNPFVGREGTRPEVWAYGLRNVWRMAFDRKSERLWAADVGQNLYEEIDLIVKGGNYGWRRREGLHPFGADGLGPRKDLIEPIWEYHHDVGKSITGGPVYRGRRLPELDGAYLYADYVTGKIWALRYDEAAKRVVANRPLRDRALPIMSFGEDEQGEVYLLTYSATGQGIYQLVRPAGR